MKKPLLSNLWKLLLTTGIFLGLTTATAFAGDNYTVTGGDMAALPDVGGTTLTIDQIVMTDTGGDDFAMAEELVIDLNGTEYPSVAFDTTVTTLTISGTCDHDSLGAIVYSSNDTVATFTVFGGATACTAGETILIDDLKVKTLYAAGLPGAAELLTVDNNTTTPGVPVAGDTMNKTITAFDLSAAEIVQTNPTVGTAGGTTITLPTLPYALSATDTIDITFPAFYDISAVNAQVAGGTFSGSSTVTCQDAGQVLTCTVSAAATNTSGTITLTGVTGKYALGTEVTVFEIEEGGTPANDIATEEGGSVSLTDIAATTSLTAAMDVTTGTLTVVGSTGAATLGITFPVALVTSDTIKITFPSNWNISGLTAAGAQDWNLDNTVTVAKSGQVVTLTLEGAQGATAETINFETNKIIPYVAGAEGNIEILIEHNNSEDIVAASTDAGVDKTIAATTAADPDASMTLSDAEVGATTSMALAATTVLTLAVDDTIVWTMPAWVNVTDGTVTQTDSFNGTGAFTCVSASNVITCTVITNTLTASAPGTITMTGLTTAYVATGTTAITDLAVNDAASPGGVMSADTTVDITTTTVGALSSCNVEPASLVTGKDSANTISLTAANEIPNLGKIKITYPSGWDVSGTSGVVATNLSNMDGTWTASVSGQVVTMTQTGGTATSAAALSFVIPSGVVTPNSTGSGGTYTILTEIAVGNDIDTLASITADTIAGGGSSSDFEGPRIPSNLAASIDENLHVVLTWTDPPDSDFTKIQIIRSKGEGVEPDSIVATIMADTEGNTVETYTDEDVVEGDIVNYILRPLDTNGNYGALASVTITVEAGEVGEEVVPGEEVPGEEVPGEEEPPTDEELYEEVVIVTESGEEIVLTDIGGHWAETEIKAMAEQEVVTGDPDGGFRPSGNLNRAEAAAILYRVLGLGEPMSPSSAPFPDVAVSAWYAGYVSELLSMALVAGNPDGTYEPTESMNRAEFLQLAMNVYYYVSDETVQAEIDALKAGEKTTAYQDLEDAWYTSVVTAATELGFVQGSVCDGGMCFNAGTEISRAEATVILYNMFYDYLTPAVE